ncbi:MAG: HipA protein [Lachnospiraceae bacterium]|nr:HipA protein [Lachnospiraceae bacterium]
MYYLMNKNNQIAVFEKSEGKLINGFTLISAIKEKLPLGFQDLDTWLDKRQAAKHREHLRQLMAQCGCLSSEGFIRITHATSLNDTFWVKEAAEKVTWEEISLYRNEFNEVISKISFEGTGLFEIDFSTTTPEFSTEGCFEKCWKREDNNIYLYKRGSTGARNAGLEPYSEFYAGQIGRILCKDFVDYSLTTLHKKTASKCILFTSEEDGFTSLSNLFQRRMTPNEMLEYYSRIGSEDAFRRMIVFDAVTFNTDRHMGNHGVIFDNDTLTVKRMAPVFDNNQSMLPYAEEDDFLHIADYLKSKIPRIGEDFVNIAKAAMTSEIRSDLINLQGIKFSYADSSRFTRQRLSAIEKIINDQIRGILDKNKLYTVDVFPKT